MGKNIHTLKSKKTSGRTTTVKKTTLASGVKRGRDGKCTTTTIIRGGVVTKEDKALAKRAGKKVQKGLRMTDAIRGALAVSKGYTLKANKKDNTLTARAKYTDGNDYIEVVELMTKAETDEWTRKHAALPAGLTFLVEYKRGFWNVMKHYGSWTVAVSAARRQE